MQCLQNGPQNGFPAPFCKLNLRSTKRQRVKHEPGAKQAPTTRLPGAHLCLLLACVCDKDRGAQVTHSFDEPASFRMHWPATHSAKCKSGVGSMAAKLVAATTLPACSREMRRHWSRVRHPTRYAQHKAALVALRNMCMTSEQCPPARARKCGGRQDAWHLICTCVSLSIWRHLSVGAGSSTRALSLSLSSYSHLSSLLFSVPFPAPRIVTLCAIRRPLSRLASSSGGRIS